MRRRGVFRTCCIVLLGGLGAVGGYVAFRAYVYSACSNHPITADGRVLDKAGRVVFARLPDPGKMERFAINDAVFWSSALWPRHVVYSGDYTYAFATRGRVFILASSGLDAYHVESRSHWTGSPRDYGYPETPTEKDWAAHVLSSTQRANE